MVLINGSMWQRFNAVNLKVPQQFPLSCFFHGAPNVMDYMSINTFSITITEHVDLIPVNNFQATESPRILCDIKGNVSRSEKVFFNNLRDVYWKVRLVHFHD